MTESKSKGYWVVNDRYAQSRCLVRDWAEFVRMYRECFGADFVELDYREREDGTIVTLEGRNWETTLVPVENEEEGTP